MYGFEVLGALSRGLEGSPVAWMPLMETQDEYIAFFYRKNTV
jgi:hypothetical protein